MCLFYPIQRLNHPSGRRYSLWARLQQYTSNCSTPGIIGGGEGSPSNHCRAGRSTVHQSWGRHFCSQPWGQEWQETGEWPVTITSLPPSLPPTLSILPSSWGILIYMLYMCIYVHMVCAYTLGWRRVLQSGSYTWQQECGPHAQGKWSGTTTTTIIIIGGSSSSSSSSRWWGLYEPGAWGNVSYLL